MFNYFIKMFFVFDILCMQIIGYVFINIYWEWVGFLEYYINVDMQIRYIDIVIYILVIYGQFTGNCDFFNEIIYMIQVV